MDRWRSAAASAAQAVGAEVLTAMWAAIDSVRADRAFSGEATATNGVAPSPTDSVQRTMNLVMPLRWPGVAWKGELVQKLSDASEALVVGLNNVGTVHFARFDLVAGNLCMFSVYDGEFSTYIRDFVATVGDVFDTVMSFVKDPPPLPVAHNVHEFVNWVARHDMFQFPDQGTDLAPNLERAGTGRPRHPLPQPRRPARRVPRLSGVLGGADTPPPVSRLVMYQLPLSDIQGNILRGYGRRYGAVRHVVLEILDPAAARAALAGLPVTDAAAVPGQTCCNVGITATGLAALGVPQSSVDTFPPEFRAGTAARAPRLGDVGPSDPASWIPGMASVDRVHIIVSLTSVEKAALDDVAPGVVAAGGGRAWRPVCDPLDGHVLDAATRVVHFGYVDGISQPRFEGVHDPDVYSDHEFAPLGTVLLGHPSAVPGVRWTVPFPDVLGRNGTFNAFRVLEQDVAGFERFLADTAAATGLDAELIAARLCGRWRNGVPLVQAASWAEAESLAADPNRSANLNDFGYLADDPDGRQCPIGAHIRRANPRDAVIVPRPGSHTRRLIRRGMPYGPAWNPEAPDNASRGLLGNFLCADLAAQFEALQGDWLNLGLLDPRITTTDDPLVGATSPLDWHAPDGSAVAPPPQLVRTRGGAYLFLPSIPAVRWITSAAWRAFG